MPYNATHRRNLSTPTTTTIQDISTQFSTLYLNHKAYSFSKPSTHPQSTAVSTAVSLTKSQSQRNRRNPRKESIKNATTVNSKKEPTKNLEGCVSLMSDNQEMSGEVRNLPQGYEVKNQSLLSIGMHRGRRRSFGCSSQVELADFLAFNGVKVVSADMPPFMQLHAVDVTRKTYDSLEKFTAKSLASTLKKEFDGVYGAAWHCIVGLSFGSFVTHSVGGFLYFSMDQKLFVLLFKTAVQRSP